MEINDGVSNIRIKIQSQGEIVSLEEQNSIDSGKNVFSQQTRAHTQQYSFSDNEKVKSNFQYKSLFYLLSHYA